MLKYTTQAQLILLLSFKHMVDFDFISDIWIQVTMQLVVNNMVSKTENQVVANEHQSDSRINVNTHSYFHKQLKCVA